MALQAASLVPASFSLPKEVASISHQEAFASSYSLCFVAFP